MAQILFKPKCLGQVTEESKEKLCGIVHKTVNYKEQSNARLLMGSSYC